MSLCKSGQIQNCCLPNALMTLKEYLQDYASPATRAVGERVIAANISEVTNPRAREVLVRRLEKITLGERDFRF